MTLDHLLTIGIVVTAAAFLFWRLRRKSGCGCGCSGCSGTIKSSPTGQCPDTKR